MKVVALAGGVGGAKLAHGLSMLLGDDLTIVVNTGDDFNHFGLRICPDLDTVIYTLGGLANPNTGWGRKDESWIVMQGIQELDGPIWFQLGDRDLATHLERTRLLTAGFSLSSVTHRFCELRGIISRVIPMTDDPFQTVVIAKSGERLGFQEYFVREKYEPEVAGFLFVGSESASAAPGVVDAIEEADLVIICPSNPWVSIGPILAINEIKQSLRTKKVIAVSPLIGGRALRGPAAKLFAEMGDVPGIAALGKFYQGLIQGMVIDHIDADLKSDLTQWSIISLVTNIIMANESDRSRLASEVIQFGKSL